MRTVTFCSHKLSSIQYTQLSGSGRGLRNNDLLWRFELNRIIIGDDRRASFLSDLDGVLCRHNVIVGIYIRLTSCSQIGALVVHSGFPPTGFAPARLPSSE